jgi:SAM-dependent methyltransferase
MPSQDASVPARREESPASRDGATTPIPRFESALLPHRATVLGLARLSPRRLFATAGLELYRHIARLTDLRPEVEFVLAPCGRGVTAQFLSATTGAAGAGVDPDPEVIEEATARAKEARLSARLHYEQGRLDDLPYQDGVFDVAIGEVGLAAAEDPAAAVAELVRVTKPMGTIVLVQFIWTGNVPAERREELAASLGVRPRLLVEWKQLLRDAGVVDLYVEDWSDTGASLRQPWPIGGLAEIRSLRDWLVMCFRAWRRWGWNGLALALRARGEIRSLVAQERILGLSLIKGTKWPKSPGR